jgi:hypothetical protein
LAIKSTICMIPQYRLYAFKHWFSTQCYMA